MTPLDTEDRVRRPRSVVRRSMLGLLVAILVMCTSAVPITAPERDPNVVGDGQRGVNVQTLLVQAVIIYDHPTATDTGEPQSSYDFLAAQGHELIRLPISWNFLQPHLEKGDRTFHPAYWNAVKAEVAKIRAAGMKTVLDLHNGCEWTPPKSTAVRVCGAGLTTADTTDVWRKLSNEFQDDSSVVAYDLFNEPVRFNNPTRVETQKPDYQPYSTYKEHVNAVVAAIRANRDTKKIWVESLCCNWTSDFAYTDPNGGWVIDPLSRIVYSQHMYPMSGSSPDEPFDPKKDDPGYEEPRGTFWADRGYDRGFLGRLDTFGNWCMRTRVTCSIGEVGWPGYGQSAASAAQWNQLGDRWYFKANYYRLDVTYFSATSAYHEGFTAYDASGSSSPWFPAAGMARKQSQAAILEKPEHLSR